MHSEDSITCIKKPLQDRAVNPFFFFYIFHIIIKIGKKLRKFGSQSVKYLPMGNLFFDTHLWFMMMMITTTITITVITTTTTKLG